MDPTDVFGEEIAAVLDRLRASEAVVDYAKVEGDEFLKLPERGFYLHARDGTGVVSDCRIYFVAADDYFPAGDEVRGRYRGIRAVADLENMLGPSVGEIRSVRIPTRPPTLPGREFVDGPLRVKAFFERPEEIRYIHVSR